MSQRTTIPKSYATPSCDKCRSDVLERLDADAGGDAGGDWFLHCDTCLYDVCRQCAEVRKTRGEKLKKNSYAEGKKPYHVYQRSDWGRKDKITLVPFKDIETLKDVRRLEK